MSFGDVGLLTEEEEEEECDFLFLFLSPLNWKSCAVVLGERKGAGLGLSNDSPEGKGDLTLLKSNDSALLLIRDSFRIHIASVGEIGGAEADTSGEWSWLDGNAGLKAEVSSSAMPCAEES